MLLKYGTLEEIGSILEYYLLIIQIGMEFSTNLDEVCLFYHCLAGDWWLDDGRTKLKWFAFRLHRRGMHTSCDSCSCLAPFFFCLGNLYIFISRNYVNNAKFSSWMMNIKSEIGWKFIYLLAIVVIVQCVHLCIMIKIIIPFQKYFYYDFINL